jgi:ubiquinone/menaquinone biosynthesis C-methylase UbiE
VTDKPHRPPAPKTRGLRIHWAGLYDALNRLHFLGREDEFREATAELAGIAAGERVLDVGCGTGNLTMAVAARALPDGEVHGIDAAPRMVRRAERKATERRLAIRYQVGLIERIPYDDEAFDVVVSSLMLHHLPRDLKLAGVAEIARVLRPGGRFLAVDVDPPLVRNLDAVSRAMEGRGFTGMRRGRTGFRTMLIPIHYLGGERPAATAGE